MTPSEGVYVYGLYLEGAGWDRTGCRLVEPKPKVLFEPLPVVHIYAVNQARLLDNRTYVCPVYKKPRRTDLTYIANITLRTDMNPDHWVLRGVALLCDMKWFNFFSLSSYLFYIKRHTDDFYYSPSS